MHFCLAVTLTFDFWPWKNLSAAWRIYLWQASLKSLHYVKRDRVKGSRCSRADRRTDKRTARKHNASDAYCWRRKHKDNHNRCMIKDELKPALCQIDKHPVTRSSQLNATDRRHATETSTYPRTNYRYIKPISKLWNSPSQFHAVINYPHVCMYVYMCEKIYNARTAKAITSARPYRPY